MLAEIFSQNLREAARQRNIPIKALSHRAGYDYDYVRRILSGKKTNPTLQLVEALAGAVGVDPIDLLKDSGLQVPSASCTCCGSEFLGE